MDSYTYQRIKHISTHAAYIHDSMKHKRRCIHEINRIYSGYKIETALLKINPVVKQDLYASVY